ncbi:MAG: DNA polymerase III subunit gamma/tau [Planctomycetes bacterium]|nr:DNA polymerase III subunit gamma/tau [Planctomycetota bacterium]
MAYTVLARRYRSQTFDEVVGQEPIARTLMNAIKSNRVAHAYLFVGTRGVGKTTMARLFAKALNGGTPEIDDLIMQGRETDTIEFDAASNTGVDEARELIANCAYKPLRGKYKIYIIDEVHMLSTSAFNALLKTMEEPPEHVKFILCTTDPQKVPATIQSRCQRYDFRNIPTQRIAEHLEAVVKREGSTADEELIFAVARLGNGSMRDALSLLDRLMASGEKHLTNKVLEELLGLPDRAVIGRLLDALAEGKPGQALEQASELIQRGISIDQLIEALASRLRDLLVLAACGPTSPLVELSEQAKAEEAARATKFDAAGIVHMIALCENVQRSVKTSAVPRALVDALVVRLALTEKFADVTALVAGSQQVSAKKR